MDKASSEKGTVGLVVGVKLEKSGPEVVTESVRHSDLSDATSETWFRLWARRGRPDVSLDDVQMDVVPKFLNGENSIACGFALAVTDPSGHPAQCEFGTSAVSHVAQRAAQRLIAEGRLKAGDLYYFHIRVDDGKSPTSGASAGESGLQGDFELKVSQVPLKYRLVPIRMLQNNASVSGTIIEQDYPVFYTRKALAKCDTFARKGAVFNPPIETGCVLCGSLCSCPETGEMFGVVYDALEATDTEAKKFSLAYSGKTWLRIQTIMRARQNQLANCTDRIFGQAHGHNFPPNDEGSSLCAECPKRPTCTRTSVFVSSQDRAWSRSVFHRQAWQICHIFGLNARSERVNKLFGLSGGQLVERGFYMVDEFDPSEWKVSE
jgi:hypothetical protein